MPDFISDMEQPWSRGKVWRRKLLYPAHTLPTAAAPLLVAVGLAAHDQVLALPAAFLAFIAGWLIQVGGVLTDNYENLLHEPEDQEHPELVRALKLGTLSLAELRVAIMVSYSIALLIGSYLLYSAGPFVLLIGVLSIAASWAYSAGPWPIGSSARRASTRSAHRGSAASCRPPGIARTKSAACATSSAAQISSSLASGLP